MKNALDKIDRFLEKYKQLCLEEGIYIDIDTLGESVLTFIKEDQEGFDDVLDNIRNDTISHINIKSPKYWMELDK